MNEGIRASVLRRGITRLCHFTPSRNFVHIATGSEGLLATSRLSEDERAVFNPTDLARLDGFEDHVCCSIQYPNAWYFRSARSKERLFKDWVVLFIDPRHLWLPGTKFCVRNAAAARGAGVEEGEEAFEALFSPSVVGSQGRTFQRGSTQAAFLTTDEQAEVLIPRRVARGNILGIAVVDEKQARNEKARLEQLRETIPTTIVPTIIVAKDFFAPADLSRLLKSGQRPEEIVYYNREHDG